MGGDDYSSAIGGGLKLKGSKPSGIKKKKSKSSKASTAVTTSTSTSTITKRPSSASPAPPTSESKETATAQDEEDSLWRQVEEREQEANYKTPTEKRHEEMRRKRLEDRLKREGGARTHKQRVEELNKYLSGLSEHHDMYVFVLSLVFVFSLGLAERLDGFLLDGFANGVVGLESDRDNRRRVVHGLLRGLFMVVSRWSCWGVMEDTRAHGEFIWCLCIKVWKFGT